MCQCQLKVSILKALRRRPNIPLRSVGSLNSSDSRVPISLLVSIHRQDLLTWNTLTPSSPRKLFQSPLAALLTLWPVVLGPPVPSWDFPMHQRMRPSWTTRREVFLDYCNHWRQLVSFRKYLPYLMLLVTETQSNKDLHKVTYIFPAHKGRMLLGGPRLVGQVFRYWGFLYFCCAVFGNWLPILGFLHCHKVVAGAL